ncbi:MAG: ATPase [Prevotella sp.]
MMLIADSGATKTDWALIVAPGTVQPFHTQGINPVHQTADDIRSILQQLVVQCRESCDTSLPMQVFFYGAGCTPQQAPLVAQLLTTELAMLAQRVQVQVFSDLMGAARALCGRQPGIACIMGTGSNSCLYDGEAIQANTPPLGYILGDEGSGASLGKRLLRGLFKGQLAEHLRELFLQESGYTYPILINKVYRQPLANRFLASLTPFISRHIDEPSLREMVVDEFRMFFRYNLAAYGRRDLPVHFVGGVANAFRRQLALAAEAEGYQLGQTEPAPITGLVAYHVQ